MAKKISQLTQATEVKSDDVTVIVQDGETKKLPLNMMVTKQDIENKKIAGLTKLDEIEATYENDTYTPTITVKNKSSVKTGEGDEVDYSANVMDGHVKSAILRGNTLVNIIKNPSEIKVVGKSAETLAKYEVNYLDNTKNYTVLFKISDYVGSGNITVSLGTSSTGLTQEVNKNGIYKFLMPSIKIGSEMNEIWIYWTASNWTDGNSANVSDIVLIEGDYTNVDIPYFEGMQSVKMPVLTTNGNNLFNMKDVGNELVDIHPGFVINSDGTWTITSSGFHYRYKYKPINFKENTQYTLSATISSKTPTIGTVMGFLYTDGTFNYISSNKNTLTSNINKTIECITFSYGAGSIVETWANIQLEEGSTSTPYEPYKTNILTVNDDVTLRGIGDVQDTLDGLTGEVIERVGEVVLDGSEHWAVNGDRITAVSYICHSVVGSLNADKIMCSEFPTITNSAINDVEMIRLSPRSGKIIIHILKTKVGIDVNTTVTSAYDTTSFKQWLSKNPLTVQYELATESIKTVDLIPSGTHPSTTPYHSIIKFRIIT